MMKEGMSGIVEFKEEQPYAVEGLLIYLYTLEYPKRDPPYFTQPSTIQTWNAITKTGDSPLQGARQKAKTADAISCAAETKVRFKSRWAQHPWEEGMALCRMGDQFGAGKLRDMAIEEFKVVTAMALVSGSAMQFLEELWELPQDGAEKSRANAIEQATQNVSKLTSPLFNGFVGKYPLFATYLIKALGKKIAEPVDN
jgi:hypothetical protein